MIDDLDNMWDVLEVLDETVTVDLDVRHAGAAGVELTPTTPPQSTAAAAPATPAKNARPKAKRTHASCDAAAPPPGDANAASPAERDASDDGTDGVDAYEEKRLKRMRCAPRPTPSPCPPPPSPPPQLSGARLACPTPVRTTTAGATGVMR